MSAAASAASRAETGARVATRGGRRRRSPAELTRTALVTSLYVGILVAFLAPLGYSLLTSLKTEDQLSQANSPLLPSDPRTFEWNGTTYDVYFVPLPDGTIRELALVRKGRQQSDFVDPASPDAGVITWEGSWRALAQPWELSPHFENYLEVWEAIDFPLHLRNTLILAIVTTIGTVISCTLVAYGFARFRFPGRGALFTLLLATLFLPAAVTLIPTYAVFVKLGWVGSYLPLLVPVFFANAYDVFLLRQYLLTIPRDHDEAAMLDGAGPFRILRSIILPQAWPVIVAVAIFTFVYSWNDYFGPLIYLAGREDLQPLQVALAHFHSIYFSDSTLIQAGNIMTLVIPVILFFIFQRVFIRGIVITGVEK
jgi:multiple sugar transport system permease protein